MQLSAVVLTMLASSASARLFILYDDINYKGAANAENQPDDGQCWNLNGKGDRASSVDGAGCTWFYRERDCTGANWYNTFAAETVPDFLNDHIWSFCNVRC